ncbi:MAG: hypothetical protein ACTSQS_15695 [Promethearchaeota archaeon]
MKSEKICIGLIFFIVHNYLMLINDEISVNNEFVWKTDIERDTFEGFKNDVNVPEDYRFYPGLEGIRIIIKQITPLGNNYEVETEYYDTSDDYLINWGEKKKTVMFNITAYSKDIYSSGEFLEDFIFCRILFIPDDVDWEELRNAVNDALKNDNTIEAFSVDYTENGFTMMVDYEEMEQLSVSLEYSGNGVLEAYRISYGGKQAVSMAQRIPISIILGWTLFIIIFIITAVISLVIINKKKKAIRRQKVKAPQKEKTKSIRATVIKADNGMKFKCSKIIADDDIPLSLRTFIMQQKEKHGIIRPENLPKSFRKDGIIYCRYEIGENIILKCYTREGGDKFSD